MMKHVLILGLGESGLAMAKWLARQGSAIRIADTRLTPPQLMALNKDCPHAEFIPGAFTPTLLEGCDALAVSPGLSIHQPEIQQLIESAQQQNLPVVGEIELFAHALAQLRQTHHYQPKIIAITGTNGKTTTTALTALLCKQAGKAVAVAGNISPAALEVLMQILDQPSVLWPEIWVLELSSFQLATISSFHADAAAVLNISQDHLDWHPDIADYAAAKARIFGNGKSFERTTQILNADDPLVVQMQNLQARIVWFSTSPPTQPNSFGVHEENGIRWLVQAIAQEAAFPSKRKDKKMDTPTNYSLHKLMPADALKIRGTHNIANALAALALCHALDLPMASLLHSVRLYQGEPHRVELIATINNVQYFDDSKGTNVGATVAALSGLDKTIILIVGGDGKGQDFTPLLEPIQQHARAVMLIGRDAPQIQHVLKSVAIPIIDCGHDDNALAKAVAQATHLAQPGDAILLSPACASFDMFRNYAHRAEVFIAAVKEIGMQRGYVC